MVIKICIVVGDGIIDPRGVDLYQNIDETVCVITSNIFNQSFVHLTNGPIVWDIVTAGGHIIKRTCWNIKVRDEVIGGLFDWLTVEYTQLPFSQKTELAQNVLVFFLFR